MFEMKFKTDNAAFEDGNRYREIARILREAADKIEDGQETGRCRDVNGNTVGTWEASI